AKYESPQPVRTISSRSGPMSSASARSDGRRRTFWSWMTCGIVAISRRMTSMDRMSGPTASVVMPWSSCRLDIRRAVAEGRTPQAGHREDEAVGAIGDPGHFHEPADRILGDGRDAEQRRSLGQPEEARLLLARSADLHPAPGKAEPNVELRLERCVQ